MSACVPLFLTSPLLSSTSLGRHAFFTRQGGCSQGLYASLNGGIGSQDDPQAVQENHRGMAQSLCVSPSHFLIPYQIHSAKTTVISSIFSQNRRPKCDALVTNQPEIALGVTGADCGILLFIDPQAHVIGAAHAGWRGAVGGIVESTLQAMELLGAHRAHIHVALGPTIFQESYEIGPEIRDEILRKEERAEIFFKPSPRAAHVFFDLPGFLAWRMAQAGIRHYEDLHRNTYAEEDYFYSFRRATHRQEPDYGRQVAAIVL